MSEAFAIGGETTRSGGYFYPGMDYAGGRKPVRERGAG
jgi:hypothetical protein